MTNPTQRAHRILKKLEMYMPADLLSVRIPDPVQERGRILGVYNPGATKLEDCIWICETGVWAFWEEWQWISYSEIVGVEYPKEKIDSNQNLWLALQDGTRKCLKVVGGQGNLRDLYEVGRFLQRAAADSRLD